MDYDSITAPDYVYKPRNNNNHHHHGKHHHKSHNNQPQGCHDNAAGGGQLNRPATAGAPPSSSTSGSAHHHASSKASSWRSGVRDGSNSDLTSPDTKNHVAPTMLKNSPATIASNGGLVPNNTSATILKHSSTVTSNNGTSTTMQQTKISSKPNNSAVKSSISINNGIKSQISTNNGIKPQLPNVTVNSTAEMNNYPRGVLPKTSPRTHLYTGHSSVVDFLYSGGLDTLSTATPALLLGPGGPSGTPASTYYSESKYAYSVSGVPGTPAQSSAAAAFFAR